MILKSSNCQSESHSRPEPKSIDQSEELGFINSIILFILRGKGLLSKRKISQSLDCKKIGEDDKWQEDIHEILLLYGWEMRLRSHL